MFTRSLFFTLAIMFFFAHSGQVLAATETVRIYSSKGDGAITSGGSGVSWDIVRSGNFVEPVNYTAIERNVYTDVNPTESYAIRRLYFPFDTSIISQEADIVSASFNLVHPHNNFNSADGISVGLLFGVQSDLDLLTTSDWQPKGFRRGANDIQMGTFISDQQSVSWNLNSFGLGSLQKGEGAVTSIILGTSADIDNENYILAGTNYIDVYMSEAPGTSTDPYLEITYTIPDEEDEFSLITQIASPYPPESADWANDIYANGSAADSCGTTTAQCGCVIASMSMLAHAYENPVGVDDAEVSPASLNEWLTKNDGYTPDGGIIWGKSLEYLGKMDGDEIKTNFSLHTHNETDHAEIRDFLDDEGLAVAFSQKYGHYFVLTDYENDTFNVRDPFWFNTKTTNDVKDATNNVQAYDGSVTKANLFAYSESKHQLSQMIEVHLGSPAELYITDESGNEVGYHPSEKDFVNTMNNASYDQSSFITTDSGVENPHVEKVAMILHPEDQTYTIDVVGTGDGPYDLTIYWVGADGYSHVANFEGNIEEGEIDMYVLFMGDAQEDVLARIDELSTYINRLPKKLKEFLSGQLVEIRGGIEDDGVLKLRPLERLLLLENVSLHDLKKKLLKKKWWGGYGDRNHGHGNDWDGCDDDNQGKSKKCDGQPSKYSHEWKKSW